MGGYPALGSTAIASPAADADAAPSMMSTMRVEAGAGADASAAPGLSRVLADAKACVARLGGELLPGRLTHDPHALVWRDTWP